MGLDAVALGAVASVANPQKAKVGGRGWTLCEPAKSKGGWAGLDAVALGAVASESKAGWAGLDAVALGAVASVAALHLRRLLPAGHHAG